jgi:curli biogenesis system outer membrane secretion channel CsgG
MVDSSSSTSSDAVVDGSINTIVRSRSRLGGGQQFRGNVSTSGNDLRALPS